MGEPAVQLDRIGKRYRLGEYTGGGTDLREAAVRLARRLAGRQRAVVTDLWSLRNVSFEIEQGQALGVVGANGAGKSTLLKIVGHITTPTEGRCRTRGRLGALLEVGTGFHGELTGLENIYLNGAILGMTRRGIKRRLDEIVDFAGVAGFLDTPVKRYSSGMYLRLAFAIAANLDADILVVDEVLAVGDAEFQRRCLGKMGEIEREGKTVVFVSHNMEALLRLCSTAVWLDHGEVQQMGPARRVVDAYLRSSLRSVPRLTFEADTAKPAQIIAAALVDDRGLPCNVFPSWSSPGIEIDVAVNNHTPGLGVAVLVSTSHGTNLFDEWSGDARPTDISANGMYRLRFDLPSILAPGDYAVGVWLGTTYEDIEFRERVLSMTIEGDDAGRPSRLLKLGTPWTVTKLDGASQAR
jgi:lipopolysaccharide transport system ATP-binding protein